MEKPQTSQSVCCSGGDISFESSGQVYNTTINSNHFYPALSEISVPLSMMHIFYA